ncbi:MAG: DNA polymerase Y family protein, partial [Thermoanaerobaculia bacterium]|nr:DNA polymerase Y family protein [Thermoanaerobaculia bacterium]
MPHRIACLEIPLFPLAARLRSEPDLKDEPAIILQGKAHAARVVAASRRARRAGIRPGATLNQARALLPGIVIRARDDTCERSARESLFEVAESFSPRVEEEEPGIVYLDIDGCERHFKGENPERELGLHLELAAQRAGLPIRVGIAGSKLAARIAAGLPPSPQIVTGQTEADFLAPLPLVRLAPDLATLEVLQRWGITSIGELARLPAAEVVGRLGWAGQSLHTRARGIDPRPLVARTPPPEFAEGMDLEWPLVALEPFLFIARTALERLSERLARQGLACSRLEISLRLEPEGYHDRTLALPAPTRDVK